MKNNIFTSVLLIALVGHLGAGTAIEEAGFDPLTAELILELPSKLAYSQDANNRLAEIINQDIKDRKESAGESVHRDNIASLLRYKDFADTYRYTSASITAKFMYGYSLLKSQDPNQIQLSRNHFSEIANHSDTFEGKFSICFNKYLDLLEGNSDPNKNKVMMISFRDLILQLLSEASKYDKKEDVLSMAVRKAITKRNEPLIEAALMLEVAAINIEVEEKEKAVIILGSVIAKFPGTIWERDAINHLNTIAILENKGLPINNRLSYPKVK